MPEGWYPDQPYLLRADSPDELQTVRPFNQGDVLANLPIPRQLRHPHSPDGKPRMKIKEGLGLVVPHPCSMRKGGPDGQLNDVIAVSPIEKIFSLCPRGWGPPWEGYEALFPLPGLLDGEDYAANLAQVGMVASGWLADRRVAILSLDGLTALQSRLSTNATRLPVRTPDVRAQVENYWAEFDLWQLWVEVSGAEAGFQAWLDELSRLRGDRTRRQTLKGDVDDFRDEMLDDLANGWQPPTR